MTTHRTALPNIYPGEHTLDVASRLRPATCLFEIEANADADIWLRIAAIFTLANVVPERATLIRGSPELVRVLVTAQGMAVGVADSVHRKLLRLSSVYSVGLTIRAD